MNYWFSATQGYYEGMQLNPADVSVPQRPDPTYQWNGSSWVQSATLLALVTPFTTSFGWQMKIDPASQLLFTQLSAVIAMNVNSLTGTALSTFLATSIPIYDTTGASHSLTFTEIQTLLAAYGNYCLGLWQLAQTPIPPLV